MPNNLESLAAQIADEFGLNPNGVQRALELLDDGNTLPFIARYRKEATRGLTEVQLRQVEDAWIYQSELASRKTTILKSLEQQSLLTPDLKKQIEACDSKKILEEIYLPYKPKRRTKATAAIEAGLGPLAELLLKQQNLGRSKQSVLKDYVDPTKGIPTPEAALEGASHIVAERWSELRDVREWLFEQSESGRVRSKVKRGKKEEGEKFELYFDFSEPLKRIVSHRFLAMKRGEKEGFLNLSVELNDDYFVRGLKRQLLKNRNFEFARELDQWVETTYKSHFLPAVASYWLAQLKEDADAEAIKVFSSNLRELLLAPPAGKQVTMGIDPGFRTGCKVAVVDATGQFLEHKTIYPTAPKNDVAGAEKIVLDLIKRHQVELIAVGNGTASRETDSFVKSILSKNELSITKMMVNESGASIYSASPLAVEEYPDLDVTVRGAISIAHRLQDPLAELVKIDAKSIGVGQYQHDVNQVQLKKSLDREVESCVNSVGVQLNTASRRLLSYVAGVGDKLASNIVQFRDKNGPFGCRKELLKVPKLGKKAFQQAAGFLRIENGTEPLDNSAVHPESYPLVQQMAKKLGVSAGKLVGNSTLAGQIAINEFVSKDTGELTLRDIVAELGKPGRDPRKEFKTVHFDDRVNEIKDLRVGMVLTGQITNVTNFGAFVDIGVHQDGLVHISQLANQFVSDPNEVVSVGDAVRVKVLEIDAPKKRISLSIKQV